MPTPIAPVNNMMSMFLPVRPPASVGLAIIAGSSISNVPSQAQVPIGGSAVSDLGNRDGNKFTRGWLAGNGGSDIENGLGCLAFDVRPASYNSRLAADFRAVVPAYGAPVAGLSNLDVDVPGRTFGPMQEARAEWIPSTWSTASYGLDIISGNVGPTLNTANNTIIGTPTSQYYAYGQVCDGGDGLPAGPPTRFNFGAKPRSNGFGLRGKKPKPVVV